MGRTIRRVPIDFDWPLRKVWKGFSNPHGLPCPEQVKNLCRGGFTNGAQWFDALCRLIMTVGVEAEVSLSEDAQCVGQIAAGLGVDPDVLQGDMSYAGASVSTRVYGKVHPHLHAWDQAPRTQLPPGVGEKFRDAGSSAEKWEVAERYLRDHPRRLLPFDQDLVELIRKLAGLSELYPNSHSIALGGSVGETLLRLVGEDPETWGRCRVCNGKGMDPASGAAYDAWERTEPPVGDGWQLWETTSAGSPVSPVFKTEDELDRWVDDNEPPSRGLEVILTNGEVNGTTW